MHVHQVRLPNIIIPEARNLLSPLMRMMSPDLLNVVEELRRRKQDHPRLPLHVGMGVGVGMCEDEEHISLFAMILFLILVFGYFKKFNEILRHLDMIYDSLI